MTTNKTTWNVNFLRKSLNADIDSPKHALIILNQPISFPLLQRLWSSTQWHCCADGGANHLFDSVDPDERMKYLPHLIKGDLDSIRSDVRNFYEHLGIPVVQEEDQYSTDLMKCVSALEEVEKVGNSKANQQYHIILLGGLSGRLDQTVHTLSYLHKLRKTRDRVFAVTDENIGWVLDAGEHDIEVDHTLLGQTCGLLPVGIDHTILSTSGLKWNLTEHISSFDGLVSTSNHLIPEEKVVWIKTSKPIWWTVELKGISSDV